MRHLTNVLVAASFALCTQAHAAGSQAGLFDITANYSGTPSALTLSAQINLYPGAADYNQQGQYYAAAQYSGILYFLGPNGWAQFDGVNIPSASSGTLGQATIPLASNINLSGAECLSVLAGYGTSIGDLLNGSLYRAIYQVPAAWPRTTPLPCSSMTDADAARFLEQATFGPTASGIADVKRLGMAGWINNQFSIPKTGYPAPGGGSWPYVPESQPTSCTSDGNSSSAASICARDNYSLFQVQRQFFQNAISGQDQLRQRVAFALSQILVISGQVSSIGKPTAFVPYQNILLDNAFGNFEDILNAITLSPAMGNYLDMVNNPKAVTPTQQPNENYARELMQLFSVGLYQLNLDGSVQTDAGGSPIPTYSQAVIQDTARALTGWTYAPAPGATSNAFNPPYYGANMIPVAQYHDTGSKQVLGAALPAGQSAAQDATATVHAVFMHPNVGPFIGKQLIQRLVTSNPSPAYVSRVASAFNDDGTGKRGNMQAVIRATLLDPEARGGMQAGVAYGHLMEPALFMARLYRSLGGVSDGVSLTSNSSVMGQNLFFPDTVFNYYPATYTLANGMSAPEFGIENTATALARANFLYSALLTAPTGNIVYAAAPSPTVTGATGTYLDLTPYIALASSSPAALIDDLNLLLLHGTMAPEVRTQLISSVTAASSNPTIQAQSALYLVANMSQSNVER